MKTASSINFTASTLTADSFISADINFVLRSDQVGILIRCDAQNFSVFCLLKAHVRTELIVEMFTATVYAHPQRHIIIG